jgi:hypothetical protein
MLVSICYRNPKSREPSDVNEAIETAVSNWFQLFSRIGELDIVKRLEPMMYDDVDQILKSYKVRDIDHRVLHTPRQEGGFGVSSLRIGGPSLVSEYEVKNLHHDMTLRSKNIIKHLIRRHNLMDTVYELDRSFIGSFSSEMSRRKVTEYKVTSDHSSRSMRSFKRKLFTERRTIAKLVDFGRTLITILNGKHAVKSEDLPYQKALMVPTAKGTMQASGFFQSIYDKTPDDQKPSLFKNEAVFVKLVSKLGLGRARQVVFKGVSWSEFRYWEFDTDFFNLISSQFVLFWYENNLYRSMSQNSLMLILEQLLPPLMSELNFEVHS